MTRVAILDDYQSVALQMADWRALPANTEVRSFSDHLSDEHAIAARLEDFEIVVAMRERTAFPRSLIERLPKLKLLVQTGVFNASLDLAAATERGVVVSRTESVLHTTAELTWGLILAAVRGIPAEDQGIRRCLRSRSALCSNGGHLTPRP